MQDERFTPGHRRLLHRLRRQAVGAARMQHRLADVPEPEPKVRRQYDYGNKGPWPAQVDKLRRPPPFDVERLLAHAQSYEDQDNYVANRLASMIGTARYRIWKWHRLLGDKDSI
jgi:hypothetical protein